MLFRLNLLYEWSLVVKTAVRYRILLAVEVRSVCWGLIKRSLADLLKIRITLSRCGSGGRELGRGRSVAGLTAVAMEMKKRKSLEVDVTLHVSSRLVGSQRCPWRLPSSEAGIRPSVDAHIWAVPVQETWAKVLVHDSRVSGRFVDNRWLQGAAPFSTCATYPNSIQALLIKYYI